MAIGTKLFCFMVVFFEITEAYIQEDWEKADLLVTQ